MSSAGKDLVGLTRIDAKHSHDSKYNYTTHTYYGWRTEAVEECVWKRDHKPLGAGAFGTVYREECIKGAPRDAVRAVKHIDRPDLARPGVAMDYGQELEAIARFSKSQYRPFFVRSEGWFETDEHICIIMELLPLGNLHHYISSGLPEAEAVMIISQVLQGLSHMHRAGYTHRDLKPQVIRAISTLQS
jgi:serine/threonine protein kinase